LRLCIFVIGDRQLRIEQDGHICDWSRIWQTNNWLYMLLYHVWFMFYWCVWLL